MQQPEEDLGSAPLVSASAFFGASTTTVSPSEVPVPTDQPSPTSPAGVLKPPATAVTAAAPAAAPAVTPAVPGGESARPISSVLDSSDMLFSSGRVESPTEMPVPTDVPSPTTPCEDEGETVTVPTVIPTAQSTRTVGEATAETPTQTLIAEGGTVATARTPTATRTFVEVRREVPTVPTAETPTRTIQVPSTQSHTRTPQEARTAITATVTQSGITRSTRSTRPTRTFLEAGTAEPLVEVPTDVPSPTSPAADPTREMETELPPSVLPPTATVLEAAPGDDEEEPTILPVPASAEPQVEEPAVEAVTPTDVPSPTSPADAEVGTLPTVEIPTLVPLQQADSALEATSPASRMEEAFSPPQVRKRRRREEVRPSTPTERFSAPPVPATPTESGTATPTEDALLVPPQEDGLEATSPASPAEEQALLAPPEARRARKKRPAPEIPLLIASPTEEGDDAEPTPTEDVLLVPPQVRVSSRQFSPGAASSAYTKTIYRGFEEPEILTPSSLPATPTCDFDSPGYEDAEPETPALEVDDEGLYAWEEEQVRSGHPPSGLIDLRMLRAQQMGSALSFEQNTPTCETDEEEEEDMPPSSASAQQMVKTEEPDEDQPPAGSSKRTVLGQAKTEPALEIPKAEASESSAARPSQEVTGPEEELPPWQRRQRRRLEE